MNLVKLITDQFSGETMDKLGSLLDTDRETAGAAASAAVPSLLASLADMVSRGDGAKKLAAVLGGIDTSNVGNFAQLLGGDTKSVANRGGSLLNSLFGENMLSGITGALSRFAGLSGTSMRSLLAFLAPLVLGKVAGVWKNQGGGIGGLTQLFADQKRHIADAVPAGFSLDDIPGLESAGDAVRIAGETTRRAADKTVEASRSLASWLLPLAALALLGVVLWTFLKRPAAAPPVTARNSEAKPTTVLKPVIDDAAATAAAAVPDAAQMTKGLKDLLTSFGDEMATINDPASAKEAMPKLEKFNTTLDGLRATWARLPKDRLPSIREAVSDQLQPIEEQADKVLAIPGLGEQFKTLLRQIIEKLTAMVAPAGKSTAATP